MKSKNAVGLGFALVALALLTLSISLVNQEPGKTQPQAPEALTPQALARLSLDFSHALHNADGQPTCSATAVSDYALLTATHCLPGKLETVDLGGRVLTLKGRLDDGADHSLLLFAPGSFVVWASLNLGPWQLGEPVFMLGNPGGLSTFFRSGYVSGSAPVMNFQGVYYDLNAHGGDSGAAVLDAHGSLRAMVSMVQGTTSGGVYTKLAVSLPFHFTAGQWGQAGVFFDLEE